MNQQNRNFYRSYITHVDNLTSTASGSLFSRFIGGIIIPLLTAAYGLHSCINQKSIFPGGRGTSLELSGNTAISFGIAQLGTAFFLHFHFIWTVSNKLFRVANFGKILSALVFLGGYGYTIWRIAIFGI